MATLAGSTIASTYTYLLKMSGTGGVTSSLVKVQDGDATDTSLSVSTTDIAVDATDKIYLDAGSDTYIVESGADVLDFYVGAANMLKLTESTLDTIAMIGNTTLTHTVTTAASTPIGLLIDSNTSGVAAQDSVGLHLDFDRTVAGSGTAAHNDIGINLDVNSASLGTSSVIGMDIDVVGAASGTSTATGLAVTVGSADTNYAAVLSGGNVLVGGTSARAMGTGSRTPVFQVEGTTYDTSSLSMICNVDDNVTAPLLIMGRSRSASLGSNTVMASGDRLGAMWFVGADGSDIISQGASIEAFVDATPGGNDMPGRLLFSTTADGAVASTERMRITSAGYVGINQTVPTTQLNVQNTTDAGTALKVESATANLAGGDILLHLDFANNTPNPDDDGYFIKAEDKHETKYLLRSDGNAYFRGQITQESIHGTHPFLKLRVDHHSDNTGTYKTVAGMKGNITNYGSTDLYSSLELYNVSASTEQLCLTIDAAKRLHATSVGIGSAATTYKLDIAEGESIAGARILNTRNPSSSPPHCLDLDFDYTPDNTTSYYIRGRDDQDGTPAAEFHIYSDGSYVQSSDRRKKENIVDAENTLDKINQLRVVDYNKKNDVDKKLHIGMIAQEVQEVFPHLVIEDDDEMKSLGVYKIGFVHLLVKAVQELSAKVTALENA